MIQDMLSTYVADGVTCTVHAKSHVSGDFAGIDNFVSAVTVIRKTLTVICKKA